MIRGELHPSVAHDTFRNSHPQASCNRKTKHAAMLTVLATSTLTNDFGDATVATLAYHNDALVHWPP